MIIHANTHAQTCVGEKEVTLDWKSGVEAENEIITNNDQTTTVLFDNTKDKLY